MINNRNIKQSIIFKLLINKYLKEIFIIIVRIIQYDQSKIIVEIKTAQPMINMNSLNF